MHVALQIIIATLSVLGLYFCLKTLASLIFTSNQISAAIIIETEKQLNDLDLLLENASSALFFARQRRILVLVHKNIWNTCSEKEKSLTTNMVDAFGATFIVI